MLKYLPEDVSTFGPKVDQMFYLIYYITGVTFVLVMVTLLAFIFMYRHQDGRRATYTHGNSTLEIIWTIVPALILVMLGLMSKTRWDEIKRNIPAGDVHVWVTAKQFNWEITYPGPDNKFGTADDLQIDNDLHVPVNKIVHITLRSKDVIHSFFLPNVRLKQDALPGREIPAWFEVTKPGEYEIPCAELCGFGHSGMEGSLIVHDAAGYEKWVKDKWPPESTAQAGSQSTEAKRG